MSFSPASGLKSPKIFQTIAAALEFVCRKGKTKHFSIVVTKGTYVDELVFPARRNLPKSFAVEIVGVDSVFIVQRKMFYVEEKVVLRDVRIFSDLDKNPTALAAIAVRNGGVVDLVNVKLSEKVKAGPGGRPYGGSLIAADKGTKVSLSNCTLKRCRVCFGEGAEAMSFTECDIEDAWIDGSAIVNVEKTRFLESGFVLRNSAVAKFTDCTFRGVKQTDEELSSGDLHPSLTVCNGTTLDIEGTTFHTLPVAVSLHHHGSKVRAENCSFVNCLEVFNIKHNADATIVNNSFSCEIVAWMFQNPKGKVIFKGNVMKENLVGESLARIRLDQYSKTPEMDFPVVEVKTSRQDVPERPSAKERSKHTLSLRKGEFLQSSDLEDVFSLREKIRHNLAHGGDDFVLQKNCERCTKLEIFCNNDSGPIPTRTRDEEPKGAVGGAVFRGGGEPYKKFKFCSACKKVCYCSVACQKADWKDHKVICAEYQSRN